jgi:hypothetical protein
MMPKTEPIARQLYSAQPWQSRHHEDYSEIVAYVEATGTWETIARVERTAGASAETAAAFIAHAINTGQQSRSVLRDAMDALQLCLEEDHLTFSSEQAAERSVTNLKKIIAG